MSIEKIVRPYQTRDVSPPRVVVSAAPGTSDDPVVSTFGKSWSLKSLNGSETLDITYYMDKTMKEKPKTR
jgi:hypothetical protein